MIQSILAMSFFGGDPVYTLLIFLSMILLGLSNGLWKEPVPVFGVKRLVVLRSLFVLALVLPFALFMGFSDFDAEFSLDSPSFRGLLVVLLISYPGLYFFVRATQDGPTSVVVPVSTSISTVIPILVNAVYLKEFHFNLISYAGIIFLLVGLALLKFRFANGRLVYMGDAGFRFAFLSAILTGTSLAIIQNIVLMVGVPVVLISQEISIFVFSISHLAISRLLIKPNSKNPAQAIRWSKEQFLRSWSQYVWIIGAIGILSGLAVIFRVVSHSSPLPKTTFILSFSCLVSVVFAKIYYAENLKPQQRLAVFFLISGIFIISWIGDGQLSGISLPF
jgi:hypothetical protein